MKKNISVLFVVIFTILVTCGFVAAEALQTTISTFPYFQCGCLIIGGLIIASLKNKYKKLYISEAIGAFTVYAIFVSLFTTPVIEMIKFLVS